MNPESVFESSTTDETKQVVELFKYCDEGQAHLLKKDLELYCFSSPKLDIATRRCIKKAQQNRRTYAECINHLLVFVDVNYRNSSYENTTLFMCACAEGNFFIIEQICNFDFTQNSFKADQKINLNIKDNFERNFLHHLLTSSIEEDDAFEIISRFVNETDLKARCFNEEENIFSLNGSYNSKKNSFEINVKHCFNNSDVYGRTPLSISLSNGWFKLSKFILMIAEEMHTNKVDLNNYIHYAVLGKSLNCLNLILKESSLDEVRQKNKDGLTPAELARKMEMIYFSKIIENFEEHCHNTNYFNIFSDKTIIQPEKIFEKFIQDDYYEVIFLLGQLNTIRTIKEKNDYSLEWNIILSKFYLNIEKETHEKTRKDSFRISPESILSKFTDNNKDKNTNKKLDKRNFLKIFADFFSGINSKNTPPNLNLNSNDTLDLIILNKGIFYFKIGDDVTTINIFLDYFKFYLDYKDYKYFKWIVYVNITFIFIEILIKNKFTKLVNLAIKKLEEFLFTRYSDKKDNFTDQNILQCEVYLNTKEIIHNLNFLSTWDESFCLLNLYKAMNNLYEYNLNDAKINFKEYKKLYNNCNYKENMPVFETLRNFYICLKIIMFYYEDNNVKCLKNLNKVYELTKIENINLAINDNKFNKNYKKDPYILFYLNTMGIMYLKQKKYYSAEIFFKTCIEHYKKIYATIDKKEFDFSIKLSDIYLIKYNLGMCYFYQKKYEEAYKIFKEIIKNKFINDYIYVWYRIGLCLLEIELNEIRKLREKNTVSQYISKTYGYEYNYNFDNNNLEKISNNINKTNINSHQMNSSKNSQGANNSSNKKIQNNVNYSNFNSSSSAVESKSAKSKDSPKKNQKEKEEYWDTVKYLNENLKDTLGFSNIDDKVDTVIENINLIRDNISNTQINQMNRRRIILQNNIFNPFENYKQINGEKSENYDEANKQEYENEEEENRKSDQENSIEVNHINTRKLMNLSESIYCMKKVIKIIRNRKFQKNNTNQYNFHNFNVDEIKKIFYNEKDKTIFAAENNGNLNNTHEISCIISEDKRKTYPKSINNLLSNTYLTLIFMLILERNWVEALGFLNDFERLEYVKKDKETRLKLNNYLVEVYLNTNQNDKAMEIIKEDLNNNNLSIEKADFYANSNNKIYNDISFRLMIHSNMIKLHFQNNNIPEAERCLLNIFNTFNFQSVYELPPFIINHMIYINMVKENFENVLNLVKFRRINMNNSSPIENPVKTSEKFSKKNQIN